ncbi:DNA-directed DNA polymerase [Clostridia bacterium]|nr:DNA-directed DNA polymerase [Clostridia bacterium]
MRPFVHLHLHTEYSLLDGAVRLDKLFSACAEAGMPAVALTDHGNMFAALKFFEAAGKHNEKSEHKVKPIFGCEFYVDRDLHIKESQDGRIPKFHHLVLLAKNYKGYENLIKLNSVAYVDGYYYKPRIDYALLAGHTEGLICLTACIAGGVPRALLAGDYEGAKSLALELKSRFEPGDFYIELQDHGIRAQKELLSQLTMLAQEIGAPLVATNDVHYLRKADAETQKVLMAIAFKRSLSETEESGGDDSYFPTEEFYLKDGDEMAELFGFVPDALDNTLQIAEKCDVEMKYKQPLLPGYTPPDGLTPFQYLQKLTEEGLAKKYCADLEAGGERAAEIRTRADYELSIVAKQGFLEYYLIVWDFIHYAESIGISVGPGRGSGVGSIIAYAIGITKVDPLKYNLLFERFLNAERVSMPDFDIDFCFERRGEVIDYVIRTYGGPRVAQIVTFGTLAAKAAIKDVGRVYGMPYSETDRIGKLIPFTPKPVPLHKYLDMIPELRQAYESDPQNRKLLDMAIAIEGMPRQTSMHAAGVVICKDDIDKFVPLQRNGEDVTTQFDMIEVEKVGLLKMDFLGLRTLTDVRKALEYVRENTGTEIDFYNMEYDDPAVYALIGGGNTDAVFQVESAGMKRFMAQLQPDNLEDIIAGIALFRPGPMDSIPTYIANKKNPAGIVYKHEILRPILDVTYGCIVYQEQVMQIVREMGGYSLGRADIVRRLMSKKKASEMKKEREIFVHGLIGKDGKTEVEGAVARGIPEDVALEVFGEMESFAQYAFNKSHAAAYAYLTYQTAYLKCHHEAEFLAAVLNNRIDKIEEIGKYLAYLKEKGMPIYPPDINASRAQFSVENGGVRVGLAALKNVGGKVIDLIVQERETNGPFQDFPDFIGRMDDSALNKKFLESLILSGSFDRFGKPRSVLMAVFERLVARTQADREARQKGQFSMFDLFGDAPAEEEYPALPELPLKEKLKAEREVLGIYISGHPLDEYRAELSAFTFNTSMIEDAGAEGADGQQSDYNDKPVRCGGVLTEFRRVVSKKSGREVGIGRLEDLYGFIEVMFSGFKYDQYKNQIQVDTAVALSGTLSQREEGDRPILRVDNMEFLRKKEESAGSRPRGAGGHGDGSGNSGNVAGAICFKYSFRNKEADGGNDQFLSEVQDVLAHYPGPCKVYLKNEDDDKTYPLDYGVKICNALLNELYTIFEPDAVLVK